MCSLLVFPTTVAAAAPIHEKCSIWRVASAFGLKIKRKRSNSNFGCKCQLRDLAPATSAAYGVLLLGGCLFAFGKSRSKGSLFGGLTGAARLFSLFPLFLHYILLLQNQLSNAYFLMQTKDTKALGDALGFGSAFLFSCVFGIRLAATKKLSPAGPLLALSIFALVVFSSAYLQDNI